MLQRDYNSFNSKYLGQKAKSYKLDQSLKGKILSFREKLTRWINKSKDYQPS